MGFVNQLLKNTLYKGKGEAMPPPDEGSDDDVKTKRVSGVDGLFVKEDENLALVVDYEFDGLPSWVEWDDESRELSVVQMNGDTVILETRIKPDDMKKIQTLKRLYLVSNKNEQKISHYVTFIVRNDNKKTL